MTQLIRQWLESRMEDFERDRQAYFRRPFSEGPVYPRLMRSARQERIHLGTFLFKQQKEQEGDSRLPKS